MDEQNYPVLGKDIFNYVVSLSPTIGSSKEEYLKNTGYDVLVKRLTVAVFADGFLIPLGVATDQEKILIQMEDVGNSSYLFANQGIDVSQLAEYGKSEGFAEFILKKDSNIKITATHTTAGGYSNSLEIRIGFHGKRI